MKPALSQVCSLDSSFEKDVEDYAAGGCEAIEIWLTKLETYLESHTIEHAQGLLDRHGMAAPVASMQGGLLGSQGEARQEAWGLLTRRLDLCRAMGIRTLVVAADVAAPLTQQDLQRAQVSLNQMAEEAGRRAVRVALEFQARAAFCNNLQTAAALVAETGSPHVGLCLDLFHYYVGPSKHEDLTHLTKDNLFHVQLCDLADVPRELATDSDRIVPGDGDFLLDGILQRLRDINYDGHISIELMNPQIWQIPALQFGEIAMSALRTLIKSTEEGGGSTKYEVRSTKQKGQR